MGYEGDPPRNGCGHLRQLLNKERLKDTPGRQLQVISEWRNHRSAIPQRQLANGLIYTKGPIGPFRLLVRRRDFFGVSLLD